MGTLSILGEYKIIDSEKVTIEFLGVYVSYDDAWFDRYNFWIKLNTSLGIWSVQNKEFLSGDEVIILCRSGEYLGHNSLVPIIVSLTLEEALRKSKEDKYKIYQDNFWWFVVPLFPEGKRIFSVS